MNYSIYLNIRKLNSNDANAIAEYTKRLNAYCKIKLYCKPASNCTEIYHMVSDINRSLFYQIQPGMTTPSSEEFALQMNTNGIQGYSNICFFIGYPCDSSDIPILSLSSMNLSVGLTGVVLYEQLYRGYRILNHQPYHK